MFTSPLGALAAIARFIEEKTGWRVVRSLQAPGALPEATARDLGIKPSPSGVP